MIYNNSRPYSFTFKKEIKLFSKERVDLFFDISTDGTICSFFFHSEDELQGETLELFSLMAKVVEGLKCEDALILSWTDLVESTEDERLNEKYDNGSLPLICEPLFFVQKSLSEFIGEREADIAISSEDEVICFCFAIKKSSITSYLESNPKASLFDLTNSLNVAGACQSCISKVNNLIYEIRKNICDYSKISLEQVRKELEGWDELETYFKMGLVKLEKKEHEKIFFQVKNPEKFNDLSKKIADYLLDKTGYFFDISFLHVL